ncbi:MAG: AAA family ATPase [Deltaproteobacteria bacterium]|nr:AAA family ATPase [Deltaproteobacteria bacterium]MBW2393492.1 AAA family ATPase [Deltaproteobacteria bacterium]
MSSEASQPIGADPFGSTTGAPAYIARPACERALDELLAAVRRDAPCIALVGPNGIGKTHLVRVLAERLTDEAELLLLPYAALEFPDLCHWALGLLGEDQGPFSDPGGALLEAAARRAASGRRLILALDDASGLPIETARELSALVGQASGELQLLVIPVDDPRAGRVLAALGSEVALVRFNAPMSPEESAGYVRERLRVSGVGPAIQDRFTEQVLAWLHRESGGLPRDLHILAVQFLRDRPEADRDRFSRHEQWLEIDATEDEPEPEPAAEAELLAAEKEEPATPTKPEPPVTLPPESDTPASQRTPLPTLSEDRGWLRSHLPLVAGLGLVALGVFFAVRADPPSEAPAATIAVPVPPQSPVEETAETAAIEPSEPVVALAPKPEQPAEPARDPSPEPPVEQPSDIAVEEPPKPAVEVLEVEETAPAPVPTIESAGVSEPETSTADLETPPAVVDPEPAAVIAEEESAGSAPITPEPLPERASEPKEIAAPAEPEPPAPEPEEPATVPATRTASTPASASPPPERPSPPITPKLLPVAATGPPVSIRVDATPQARVLINGRDQGQTPLTDLSLPSGRHRFEIIFPGGTHLLREKLIDAQHTEISFTQLPTP